MPMSTMNRVITGVRNGKPHRISPEQARSRETTMNVTLSGDIEQFIREEVASGRYDSPQEVVREGLRLLDQQRRERLNQQIEEGLAQLDRGEGIPGEDVFQGLWEKSRSRRAAR